MAADTTTHSVPLRSEGAETDDLLNKLEDFFCDPALTGAISDFAAQHAAEIVP